MKTVGSGETYPPESRHLKLKDIIWRKWSRRDEAYNWVSLNNGSTGSLFTLQKPTKKGYQLYGQALSSLSEVSHTAATLRRQVGCPLKIGSPTKCSYSFCSCGCVLFKVGPTPLQNKQKCNQKMERCSFWRSFWFSF